MNKKIQAIIQNAVRIGYGPYQTKQELEEAELNAWLATPLSERKEIMRKASVEYDTPEKRKAYIARLKEKFK